MRDRKIHVTIGYSFILESRNVLHQRVGWLGWLCDSDVISMTLDLK